MQDRKAELEERLSHLEMCRLKARADGFGDRCGRWQEVWCGDHWLCWDFDLQQMLAKGILADEGPLLVTIAVFAFHAFQFICVRTTAV